MQLPEVACMDVKLAMASNCGLGRVEVETHSRGPFPAGLRVLVVDDDPICLLILDRLLRHCLYQVTTCDKATAALEILREKKSCFDLIISDVYMPDMDGFKLLELVGLEMDLPVIMMSADGETSAVMKGIQHGACDYLLKPVRIEELRNIWQHVVRKKWRTSEERPSLGAGKHQRMADDGDCISSEDEGLDEVWKPCKKRKDIREEGEDGDPDDDDPSTKKPRVVWSGDLHHRFLASVSQLGIDKAVPKRILELMNVPGLTRENVASHLQKFRLYLKRLSALGHQPGGLNSSFAGLQDPDFGAVGVCGLGRSRDTLAVTGQLSPQSLVPSLQAGLLGSLAPTNNLMGSVDPSLLLAALQLTNNSAFARPWYSQASLSNQGNLLGGGLSDLKQLAKASQQVAAIEQMAGSIDKRPTGISALQQQLAGAVGLGGVEQLVGVKNNLQHNPNNNAWMTQALQQQSGGHQTSGACLTLPTGGTPGQHKMGAWASSLSNVNKANAGFGSDSAIGSARLLRPGSPSTVVYTSSFSPSTLPTLGGTSTAANKDIQLPNVGINVPVPSPGVSSPLALTGLDKDLGANRIEMNGSSFNGVSEHSMQTFSSFASNFASLSGMRDELGPNTCPKNQAGWQRFGFSQEFGQASSPILNPKCSQGSASAQNLNLGVGQTEAQLQNPGFDMWLSCNSHMDGGCLNSSVCSTPSQSERSTVESDLKVNEDSLGLLMGSKAEHRLLQEADDLLNLCLKQRREIRPHWG